MRERGAPTGRSRPAPVPATSPSQAGAEETFIPAGTLLGGQVAAEGTLIPLPFSGKRAERAFLPPAKPSGVSPVRRECRSSREADPGSARPAKRGFGGPGPKRGTDTAARAEAVGRKEASFQVCPSSGNPHPTGPTRERKEASFQVCPSPGASRGSAWKEALFHEGPWPRGTWRRTRMGAPGTPVFSGASPRAPCGSGSVPA